MKKITASILVLIAGVLSLSCSEKERDLWADKGGSDSGDNTEINLAAGKFYKFTGTASEQYPDLYPLDPWSSGTKLTDEDTGDIRNKTVGVSWKSQDVDITVDLGKNRSLSSCTMHAIIDNVWKSGLPSETEVSLSTDSKTWESAGYIVWDKEGNSTSVWGRLEISEKSARYVKFSLKAPAAPADNFLIDELQVFGEYVSDWKYVPEKGAYHGAFNNNQTFYDEEDKDQTKHFVTAFENLVGKKTSMMLWYKGMRPDRFFDYIHETMGQYTAENRSEDDRRFFIYGWLPDDYKAAQLAQGVLDENWKEYFRQVREYQASDEDYGPVWFRPANEMNGSWSNYSGDPVNYVRFWRRMYNVAEQMGITDYNVFVW